LSFFCILLVKVKKSRKKHLNSQNIRYKAGFFCYNIGQFSRFDRCFFKHFRQIFGHHPTSGWLCGAKALQKPMARYKTYDYDQTHLIPVCWEDHLLEGSLEHAIHVLVENKMDMRMFDWRYHNDETGCPAYDPKILLKAILFAYSHGFVGSRRIEWLCRKHVTCMALSCMQHPDHSSIASFVASMAAEILSWFRDILLVCAEQQLLGGTVFALDGLKLPSNASKRWSGPLEELKHMQEKLEARIQQLLPEHQQVDAGQAKEAASTPESRVSSEAECAGIVSESGSCKDAVTDPEQSAQQAGDVQQAPASHIAGTVNLEVPGDEETQRFKAQAQARGTRDWGWQEQRSRTKGVKAGSTGKRCKAHTPNSRKHPRKQSKGDKHNRAERVKRLRRHAERLKKWLAPNEKKIGRQGKEMKRNITDNESAKRSTSHGVIQGFNAQAVVDDKHQVIVAAEAFGDGQDGRHLSLMMPPLKDNMKAIGFGGDFFEGKQFLLESNYFSDTNLKTCEDEQLDAYIPDCNFRKRDPRFADQKRYKPKKKKKKKRFGVEDFTYDEVTECYRGPNRKLVRLRVHEQRVRHRIYRRYVADEEDCRDCPFHRKCLSQKKTKRKHVGIPVDAPETKPKSRCQQMIEKIDPADGKTQDRRRLEIVEPVFANIRTQKGLDHFTLRGKQKVDIQWMLYAMVHHIEKIANYGEIAWKG
jgi:transposase